MFSEFLKRKMTLGFYRMDLNRDGFLDAADFRRLSERIAELNGVEAGTAAYDNIFVAYDKAWQLYFQHADADGDGRVTVSEFLQSTENLVTMDGFDEVGAQQNQTMFDALDLDGDGLIQADEFGAFLGAAGVHQDNVAVAFCKLDSDGDGVISRDEFALALHQYFTSEDLNVAGNWFFGPF